MSLAEPLLALEEIDVHWPHCALFSALNWRVPTGAALVQGGPSSGKTTLLRVLAGVLPATRGKVLWSGAPVKPNQVFWPEREAHGAEKVLLRHWWRLLEQRYRGWDTAAFERHVAGFALAPHQDKAFFMLSTGTRRKAWLAAALASGAPLTLIDEPLAGLDLASARYLAAAIADAAPVDTASVDTAPVDTAPVHAGRQPSRVIVVAHDAPIDGVPWVAQLVLPDAV